MRYGIFAVLPAIVSLLLTGCGSRLSGPEMANAVQVADDTIRLDENGRAINMSQISTKEP